MALTPLETLKSRVVRGWKPLVTQVNDWLDSFWHKSSLIPISSIDGLQDILNSLPTAIAINNLLATLAPDVVNLNANGFYDLPANKILSAIQIESVTNQVISLGTTDGGSEIFGAVEITANEPHVAVAIVAATGVIKRLYITGVTGPITLKFYKQ
jgi:hypothetical protein